MDITVVGETYTGTWSWPGLSQVPPTLLLPESFRLDIPQVGLPPSISFVGQ